jgi:hypothetical protein
MNMTQTETTGIRELSSDETRFIAGGSQEELIAEYDLTIGAVKVEVAAKEIVGTVAKALGQLF